MTDWFRSWHGAPTHRMDSDSQQGASITCVTLRHQWSHCHSKSHTRNGVRFGVGEFDHASQHTERGTVSDFDAETYAAFSGFDENAIKAVILAFSDKGLIVDGRFAKWEKRQPKREDSSKDRTAEWRGRKNKTSQNGGNSGKRSVTLGDASVTQCDAMRRPRVEKIREEERREEGLPECDSPSLPRNTETTEFVERVRHSPKNANGARACDLFGSIAATEKLKRDHNWPADFFELFWAQFPNKIGKAAAKKSLLKVANGGNVEFSVVMNGLLRYVHKTDDRAWCNPTTWINQERWSDEPAQQPQRNGYGHKQTAGDLGRELAAEIREREIAAGLGRPFVAV